MPEQIDGIDAKILHLIQSNAALSVADIADKVGLSSSPCWRRIKRKFEKAVARMPEIVQCASVTGAVDFMLRVVTKDMHSYEDFLREVLLSIDLISDVQSRIVLRQTKESYSIPLNLISNAVPRL